jgi:peroxiredoxin
MPTIEALGQDYRSREVDLWGITFDPADVVRTWLMQHHHSLPTISDPSFLVSDLYKVEGIPTIVLIGRDGKVKSYWVGEVSKETIEAALNRAIQR